MIENAGIPAKPADRRLNWRAISLLMVGAALIAFMAANAHLVYVAFASQPECVAHQKAGSGTGSSFAAAKPAC